MDVLDVVGVISKLHLYPLLVLWLRLENTQLECYPIVRTKLDSVQLPLPGP